MKAAVLSPFFLPGSAGQLFSLYFRPGQEGHPEHFILLFPPFAEELNKARRMLSLQARKFAAMGYGVLLVDYYGTGDSAGNFGDATWAIWQEDLGAIVAWLEQAGAKQVSLWGLRLGAMVAMHSLPRLRDRLGDRLNRILLWQPSLRGDQLMTQFLRLRLAADMIGAGSKVTVQDLRDQLAAGGHVEVAGYELSPGLVEGLDSLNMLNLGAAESPPVEWFEVVSSEDQPLSPASQKVLGAWRDAGMQVSTHTAMGEPFWVTPEITVLPALLEKTSALMQRDDSGR
ncbi:MAG: hydrolase 2, exosortase A system-associated [Gammaproteobacteria bacterium]|nr:hydrolase 2, exosortase A system-associated [Gammaproteobacteria bacterium]